MTEELKLRECPFCGTPARKQKGGTLSTMVFCPNNRCPAQPSVEGEDFHEDVFVMWNARAPSPELTQLVKAARDTQMLVAKEAMNGTCSQAMFDNQRALSEALASFKEVE